MIEPGQVWVVEDSPLQLEHLRNLLAKEHQVTGFTSGDALLERLVHTSPPELIVLDWEMPGIEGVEVCRFIRERYDESTLPILMVTVRDAREDFAEGLAAGANDYVAKPFHEGELLMRANGLLRGRRRGHELARAMSRVVEVLESMGDIFFALDSSFRLRLVNHHYEKWTHTRREEIVGRNFWELYPDVARPESVYWREYHRCARDRVQVHFLDYYAPLEFWADVRAYPTADGGIAVFIRDVSVEKKAEDALKHQADFEQHLIGIVSHDLRNPLNAISLASGALTRREELDERTMRGVVRIRNAADRATRLVNDLLDFTQARLGGGIRIQRGPCDLRAVLSGVVEEVEAAWPGRTILAGHDGDLQGEWDADRLAQVLLNLIANALQYSPAGSAVSVVIHAEEAAVQLTVHNGGAPIPSEMLPSIFEPLRRGGNTGSGSARSVGLGLYIVKQLVEAHGGSIQVRSNESEGTTFTVRLPRRP